MIRSDRFSHRRAASTGRRPRLFERLENRQLMAADLRNWCPPYGPINVGAIDVDPAVSVSAVGAADVGPIYSNAGIHRSSVRDLKGLRITPVNATILQLGDIAFTGYQATTTDKVSFVLLKSVDSGSVLTIADNAWTGTALSTNEGTSVIAFGASFAAGTQFNYDATRASGTRWAVGSTTTGLADTTSAGFALNAAGDNLFAYNGSTAPTSGNDSGWVAAMASNQFVAAGGSSTASLTLLPSAFTLGDTAFSLALANGAANENGAMVTPASVTGTPSQIRTVVNTLANWTTYTTLTGAPAIPPNIVFTVTAGSNNNAPTGLSLSSTSIVENAGVNAVVGTLSTTDPDAGNTFTYSLVTGVGSSDNASFNLSGNALRASANFDFETKSSYSIRLRTTDQGGLFFEQTFTISVIDVFETFNALRIVSYNVTSASGAPRSGMGTILQAIGTEIVSGLSRPIDLIAMQEVLSQATTSIDVAGLLNTAYSTVAYAASSLNGTTTGAGTQGFVYNTQTLSLLEESAIGTSSTTGQPRQTVRAKFRPAGTSGTSDFYVYNSHFKSANSSADEARRLVEAQAIRASADALGEGAHVLYVGDFNLYRATDPSFVQLTASGNGQAFDPVNRIGPWSGNSSFVDIFTQAPAQNPPGGLTGGGLDDRFDFQLISGELKDGSGLDYRTGSYHTFGNNGSVPVNGDINSPANTALAGLANRTTVLNLLTTVSDHLPVVADYVYSTDAPAPGPKTSGPILINNGQSQRSMVTSLTVNFDTPVSIAADAFVIERRANAALGIASGTVSYLATQASPTQVKLTFTGSGIQAGSLSDGQYDLTILASRVTSSGGSQLDGNGDGSAGDNYQSSAADNFFRLLGDGNGDGVVDTIDASAFQRTLYRSVGDPAFDSAFDYDGDGDVDALDYRIFRPSIGRRLF